MQKIKVLHIIKSLGRGGAEMLLPETLSLHDKSKFEFHYIYFLPWKDQMESSILNAGGIVSCFPSKNNIEILRKESKIKDYCHQHNIDIIHCHLPWAGFVGRIVHKKTGIPLIYTEHNIQERYHFATKLINKLSFNYQSISLGVSRDVSESIRKNIDPKIPVKTLLNGVNTNKFKKNVAQGIRVRQEYGIPEDALVIGNIAVFREQKAIPNWVKAFKSLNQKNPAVFGLLVGAGPKEREVRRLIKELKLTDRIILPGLQKNTIPYFSAMDIFMMSSSFEGLPIALLEAMSMECAIVSTKAGGVVEVIEDGENGLLCETEDWQGLSKKVNFLVENSVERRSLQIKAREKVESFFSLSAMVKELEEHYSGLR